MTKCDGAPNIWCHLKIFAMVSEKKLQNIDCRAIFTFKTMKNGQNWSKNDPCPGARQFKGDSLLVTLDPYPSNNFGFNEEPELR